MVRLIDGPGNPYGFFSGHAANTIGFAILTSLIIRRRAWSIVSMIWALLVCYSRSYLGHHYPIDVLTGILCGIIFALLGLWIYRFLMRKIAT
jgi:undecaprenyl-diphosphatase